MLHDMLFSVMMISFPLIASAQLVPIRYTDGNQTLVSLLGKPESINNQTKGILILPAWMGISQHEQDVAVQLNKMGYFSMVADIYGSGKYPSNKREAGEIATYYKTHTSQYRHRINIALQEFIKAGANADHIIIIGYCFGGTGALEAARSNMPVEGVVSFHGGLRRDDMYEVKTIKPKVLVLHGADDVYVTQQDILAFQEEMRKSGADWQMNYYSGAVHAFTDPAAGTDKSTGAAYNQEADQKSWNDFMTFLKWVWQN